MLLVTLRVLSHYCIHNAPDNLIGGGPEQVHEFFLEVTYALHFTVHLQKVPKPVYLAHTHTKSTKVYRT